MISIDPLVGTDSAARGQHRLPHSHLEMIEPLQIAFDEHHELRDDTAGLRGRSERPPRQCDSYPT